MSNAHPPRLRADAARNRQRLVETARDLFAVPGAQVSLEAVARAAGVGIGTLYRHFPTRDALVEAVYRSELDAVTAAAEELLTSQPAFDALRRWMDRYTSFVAAKRGMLDALRTAWASATISRSETRTRITATLARFLEAGAADGTLRDDVEPDDVTAALVGSHLATSNADDLDQLRRLLDLLVDGLRPRR